MRCLTLGLYRDSHGLKMLKVVELVLYSQFVNNLDPPIVSKYIIFTIENFMNLYWVPSLSMCSSLILLEDIFFDRFWRALKNENMEIFSKKIVGKSIFPYYSTWNFKYSRYEIFVTPSNTRNFMWNTVGNYF